MAKRPNIYDIASEAGVSIAMVSRVVNNSGPVAEEKRKKIQQILDKRGYQPSHAARALASNKHQAIGIVFREITQDYYQLVASQVIAGISAWCRSNHRYLTMVWGDDDQIEESVNGVVNQVDGLLFLDVPITDALHDLLEKRKTPYVLINEPSGRYQVPAVLSDNRTGGLLAAEHLIKAGHEKIMLICGADGHHASMDRAQGALSACRSAGIQIPDEWVVDTDYFPQKAREAVQAVFADADPASRPTAIISASDTMAIAVMRELRSLGLNVPNDVSVIGYDDSLVARAADPPLSSVNQPFADMGKRGADLLKDLIDGKLDAAQVALPVSLIERESVSKLN